MTGLVVLVLIVFAVLDLSLFVIWAVTGRPQRCKDRLP